MIEEVKKYAQGETVRLYTEAEVAAAVQAEREACARAIGDLRTADTVTARAVVIDGMRAIRSRGPAPAQPCEECEGDGWIDFENPLTGVWRCSCCGEMFDGISPEWRMIDGKMEHKCPGNDPQAGYFAARFFPNEVPAVDVLGVVREYVEANEVWRKAISINCTDDFGPIVAATQRIKAAESALRSLVDGAAANDKGGK